MMLKASSTPNQSPPIDEGSYMPGLAPYRRQTTYLTKLSSYERDIQTMNLLRISEVGLISKEGDLSRFWTDSHLALSKKLLSLTRTDSVDLDSRSSSALRNRTTEDSWFLAKHRSLLKKNLCRTLFSSSMYSPVEFTASGNTLIKSRKTRIYPKREDLQKFRKYLGLSRYWFNKTVEHLKKPGTVASLFKVRSIQQEEHPAWAFDCPQRIREHAMREACGAVGNAKIKCKQSGQFQEVHFRKKKDPRQRFGFDKQSLRDSGVFRGNRRVSFLLTENISADREGTKIVLENGRWFLVTPMTATVKMPDNQRLGTVALDPGVRTFQTFFSPFVFGKVGQSDFSRVYRLCVRVDKAISKLSKSDYRTRKRIKRAIHRLKWRVRDCVDDLHKKFAHFLVKNFDTVFIPTFEISSMVSKLHSKTARSMLTWAHYRFRQFLKFKGIEYSCKILEVSEAYTSRTCSFCGKDHQIRSKKLLKCSCGREVDRDFNGARGIFLKNFLLAMPASALLD